MKIVACNWKMNVSHVEVQSLSQGLIKIISPQDNVIVFPPYIYLDYVSKVLDNTPISWGAQDVSEVDKGARTGEISLAMLQDFNVNTVLLGHSERRMWHDENNLHLNKKIQLLNASSMNILLCVGESDIERQENRWREVIQSQLEVLSHCSHLNSLMIAYEPVWAIGTGKVAQLEDISEVHRFISHTVKDLFALNDQKIPILYGGSVKSTNASNILALEEVDGVLLGGSSLDLTEVKFILECAR